MDPALAQFEAERDRLAFLAIGIAIVATAGIFVFRRPLYTTVPLLAAACYAVTVAMLWGEIRALTRKERSA